MTDRIPLVLLPGLLNDRALWQAQVAGLADVAAPEVPDLTRRESVAELAGDVLADAPERFALAGLSMGGYVAFEILRQAPERVTRLALLDTRADPDGPEQVQRRQDMIQLARDGSFAEVPERLLPVLVHEPYREDPQVAGTLRQMARRVGPEGFIRQQTAIMNRPDSRPLLPEIGVPTLVLCGRQDQLSPVDTHQEMARQVPQAELVVVEDAGHLTPLEQPDAVTRALRAWLQGRPAAG
jgi:pimeloyl-ACP methyl ester carboxylesterase